jgi:hypothetical protein
MTLRQVRVLLLTTVAVLVSFSTAHRANAWTGDLCQGASWTDAEKITYTSGQLRVSASAGQDVKIACPVIKTTSGPGVTNDAITQASVRFANANPYPADCSLSIYSAAAGRTSVNLVKRINGHVNAGTNTLKITPTGSELVTRYWKGLGLIGGNSWYYAQVECTLKPGAIVKYFSVVEAGVDQPGMRIAPSSYCYNGNGPKYRTIHVPDSTQSFMTASNAPAGSNPPGEAGFNPLCTAPAGTGAAVQISVGAGASTAGYAVLCNTTNAMGVEWRRWNYDHNIIDAKLQWVLTFSTQTAPDKYGLGIRCRMVDQQDVSTINGDAWIFSHRTANTSSQFGLW